MSTNNDLLAMLFRIDPKSIEGVTIARANDSPKKPWNIVRGMYCHAINPNPVSPITGNPYPYPHKHSLYRLGISEWDLKRWNLKVCFDCINLEVNMYGIDKSDPVVNIVRNPTIWVLTRCKHQSGETPMRFQIVEV